MWTCFSSGNWSGASREVRYTDVSNFFACAWASALSNHLSMLPSTLMN
jgi:hypothetical protein